MGNVIVSLDDEYEDMLRRLARERYNGKKGSLSQVVKDALERMAQGSHENLKEDFKKALAKGIRFKYKMYSSRSEIYD